MSDQPAQSTQLQAYETRIYFDAESGEILHVHQLVSGPGELDTERVAEEMSDFGSQLRDRFGSVSLDYLLVEASELPEGDEPVAVDVERRQLVPKGQRPSRA